MKIFKTIAWILLLAFVAIQFFPTERNQSGTVPKSDFILVNAPPENISNLLRVSCYDCHSDNTTYPWYNRVQPAAWYMEGHIKHGKGELNFNYWDELSKRRKASKLKSIISQITNDEMPIYSYTLIHRNAMFSDEEKLAIIDYMTEMKRKLE